MKQYKRLFTFGCSFTWWPWPTWANIIAHELNIPFQNWGLHGLGNVAINGRILEASLKNNIDEDDLLLVVWSSWTREDRYNVKNGINTMFWSCTGDVLHSYNKEFIEKYWSLSNDIYKNSTSIIQTNMSFNIHFNGHITNPLTHEWNNGILCFDEDETTLAKFYQQYIPIDGVYEENLCCYTSLQESHPSVLQHLQYVQKHICPKLGITLSEHTVKYFTEMHNSLLDFTKDLDPSDNCEVNYRVLIQNHLRENYGWTTGTLYGFG